MHRWLLLLMIALLPLRGWVGEAMAGEMLQQHLAVAAGQSVEVPHECPGHEVMAAAEPHAGPAAPVDAAPVPADCATCASCQVCSSVAFALPVHSLPALSFSQPRPAGPMAVHASAERAPAFKPPIS